MTCFTFDTAHIVAHLQNHANECVKSDIRARLDEMIYAPDFVANGNRLAFLRFQEHLATYPEYSILYPESLPTRPSDYMHDILF